MKNAINETDLFIIECDKNNMRLDQYLADNLQGFSRTRIQSLIKSNSVLVNGKPGKPSQRLEVGDSIEGEIPPLSLLSIEPANIPLNIVYEDKELIIVDKPKNMVVHPSPGHFNDTLVNGLMYHCGAELSGINGVMRPGIVHRIDKDTTGLLIVAKTNDAHICISEQLSSHSIERAYEALVNGVIKEDSGTINAPIGRNEKDRTKMSVSSKSGKPAITHFKVLKRFGKYTHINARLETGRTHQIRVHFAHYGFPVLGDEKYSNGKQPFRTNGQVLHAKSLGFFHPKTKEYMRFDSELPQYFTELLTKLV